jgi:hypothetical protein
MKSWFFEIPEYFFVIIVLAFVLGIAGSIVFFQLPQPVRVHEGPSNGGVDKVIMPERK